MVHGDLSYAAPCDGDEEVGICHVPQPGEADDVYWLGFDCGHAFDLMPALDANQRAMGWEVLSERVYPGIPATTYKDLAYVRAETEHLADQLAAMA